jgi:hypothetical protein
MFICVNIYLYQRLVVLTDGGSQSFGDEGRRNDGLIEGHRLVEPLGGPESKAAGRGDVHAKVRLRPAWEELGKRSV